jgi:hypothetical protein
MENLKLVKRKIFATAIQPMPYHCTDLTSKAPPKIKSYTISKTTTSKAECVVDVTVFLDIRELKREMEW